MLLECFLSPSCKTKGKEGGCTPNKLDLLMFVPFAALSEEPLSMAGRKCNTIYKGFADCLISLGDSMTQSVQQQQDESSEELQELETICK